MLQLQPMPCSPTIAALNSRIPAGKFFLVQFPQFSTLLLPLEPLIRLCECTQGQRKRLCERLSALRIVCGSSTPSVWLVLMTSLGQKRRAGCQKRNCMRRLTGTV